MRKHVFVVGCFEPYNEYLHGIFASLREAQKALKLFRPGTYHIYRWPLNAENPGEKLLAVWEVE